MSSNVAHHPDRGCVTQKTLQMRRSRRSIGLVLPSETARLTDVLLSKTATDAVVEKEAC